MRKRYNWNKRENEKRIIAIWSEGNKFETNLQILNFNKTSSNAANLKMIKKEIVKSIFCTEKKVQRKRTE